MHSTARAVFWAVHRGSDGQKTIFDKHSLVSQLSDRSLVRAPPTPPAQVKTEEKLFFIPTIIQSNFDPWP